MMNIRRILYKSFERNLSSPEDKKLKEKLLFSKKLREKKFKIEKLRIMLATRNTGRFNPEFENNLVKKIRSADYPQIFLYKEIQFAFKKFVFAALVIITFLVIFNFSEHGKINILRNEKLKLGEEIINEYLYSFENLKGNSNGL